MARILSMLGAAAPTTLRGSTRILAVAILHERPHQTAHSAQEIARILVDQYKGPGWVPAVLNVGAETPIEMRHRPDGGALPASEANAILADMLSELAPGADLDVCSAIGFSGDNPALGHTYFAILAWGHGALRTA